MGRFRFFLFMLMMILQFIIGFAAGSNDGRIRSRIDLLNDDSLSKVERLNCYNSLLKGKQDGKKEE